jgi:4-amino-4-deoxy-L-arabinose transferase-like glycosyltransferase
VADRVAVILTATTAAVHLICAPYYDFFGDELYFIVCGQHPAFGYADQPPLVPLLSAGLYTIDSQTWFVRLPAVFAAAGLVWLTIALTRLLGGGNLAAWMAGLAAAGAPMLAGLTAVLSTSTFEPLAWTAFAFLVARAIYRDEMRALLWAGVVAGICLEAKYVMVLWMAALALGILLTPERRIFMCRPFWIGLVIAGVLGAPSFMWQALHGMPFLELVKASRFKNIALSPFDYVDRLAFGMNIILAPVWIAGATAPFLASRLSQARFLAIGFIFVLIAIFCLHGKDYYAAGAFPAAFAIGSFASERILVTMRIQWVYIAVVLVSTAISLPLALPLLPPAVLLAYESRMQIAPPRQFWFEKRADLPLTFGFELGWHDFVAQVAQGYDIIPPAERPDTAILVDDYAEAAAIDLYGHAYGLPPALSGHNQYFFWALRGQNPTNILYVHGSEAWNDAATRPPGATCVATRTLGKTHSEFALIFETGKRMTLCTGMQPDLATLWPSLRFMY